MELRELLQFDKAEILTITSQPTKDGPKKILHLSAPLSKENAIKLGVGYAYAPSSPVPVDGLSKAGLGHEWTNLEVHLPTDASGIFTTFSADIVGSFNLKRIEDAQYEISMRIHISSRLEEVEMFFMLTNAQKFEFAIRPRQGELFEGGTRVERGAIQAQLEEVEVVQ